MSNATIRKEKPGILNTLSKVFGLIHRTVDMVEEAVGVIEDGVRTTRLHSQHMYASTQVELSAELKALQAELNSVEPKSITASS